MTAAFYISAGFNLSQLNSLSSLGTITFRRTAKPNIVITIANLAANDSTATSSKYFWHMFNNSVFGIVGNDIAETVRYPWFATSSLGLALQTAVRAQQTAEGWETSNFAAQWYEETPGGLPKPAYRFTNTNAFTWQFSTLAGARLFGGNVTTESTPATTTWEMATPSYCWDPHPGASAPGAISADQEFEALDYWAEGGASLVISDSGIGYGNSRLTMPMYRDFKVKFRPKAYTHRSAAASTYWSLQDLHDHCRCEYPFYVARGGFGDSTNYPVFQFTTEGVTFRPRTASEANHAQLHASFRCLSVGEIVYPS